MRRSAVAVALVTIVTIVTIVSRAAPAVAGAVQSAPAVTYRPPVDAPVVDPFRPPPRPWADGNRGLEYATVPGTPARASADGEVVFAGQVGGSLHAVLLHPDGIRTSYSFLASIAVHRGDRVRQGDTVGTTADRFHFGARAGDEYIDPQRLFSAGPPRVHLVPDSLRRPASEKEERKGLLRGIGRRIGRVIGGSVDAADWARRKAGTAAVGIGRAAQAGIALSARVAYARVAGYLDELRGFVHYASALQPMAVAREMGRAAREWWHDRRDCTPSSRHPPRLEQRHLAILVGGLGSSSREAAVDDVDTTALGYQISDVSRFSYRGGTTGQNRYVPTDTTTDIRWSGRRLREVLQEAAKANPGVPIDIIAHSQGGLVARAALTFEYDGLDRRLPPIGALVTLGTPHRGTDGATALGMFGHTGPGAGLKWAYHQLRPHDFDPRGESLRQMSETSWFIHDLNGHTPPAGVWITSIAARDDIVVPARHARVGGAHNVVVASPGGLKEHEKLPGSQAARREIALALAHLPPTCQSFVTAMGRAFVSAEISTVEDAAGAGLWAAGRLAHVAPG